MVELGTVITRFVSDTSDLMRGCEQSQECVSGFGKLAAGVGVAAGAAIIGVGIASVQAASKYQQSMNMVQALTGASNDQMKAYDSSLKSLAVDAGVAPDALSKGLYNVISAGYSGKDAMTALTLATEDAKIGMTDASTTTNALTNVMRGFGLQSSDLTRINGEMLSTVTLGKMTMEQYATSVVKGATAASQFHVSAETMNAALATMTSTGIPAAQAATDFQQSLKVMDGNIGTVTASLKKSGIAFNETKFNTMSYGQQVVYLNTELEQANEKHVKVTGVTLQAAQAITKIAQNVGMYNSDLAQLSNKTDMANKTSQAWAQTQAGFAQTMSRLQAALQVVLIDIGQALLPMLTKLAAAAIPIINNFAAWESQTHGIEAGISALITGITDLITTVTTIVTFFQKNQVAADLLAGAIVGLTVAIIAANASALIASITAIPAVVVGFGAWAVAAGAAAIATLAAAAPFIAIGIVVALVVAGIILAIQHWGEITKWFQNLWADFTRWFTGAMGDLGTMSQKIWQQIALGFVSLGNMAMTWGRNLIQGFVNGIMSMVGAVGNAVGAVGNTIKNFLGIHSPAEMGPLAEADTWAPNLIKLYATGMQSGLPQIAAAATSVATPLAAGAGGGGGRSQTAHIHVYLGGKEIVSQLMPMIYDETRALTGWRPVA